MSKLVAKYEYHTDDGRVARVTAEIDGDLLKLITATNGRDMLPEIKPLLEALEGFLIKEGAI